MYGILRRRESVMLEQLEVVLVGHAAVVLYLVVSRNDEHVADLLGGYRANIVLQRPLRAPVGAARTSVAQAWTGAHAELADSATWAARADQVLENKFGVKPAVR